MVRLKNLHDHSLRWFWKNGNYPALDKEETRNDAIITELFNRTQNGTIKGFYLVSDKWFRAYHRSPKNPGQIQESIGYYCNGELIPQSDGQYTTAKELIRSGLHSGIYEIIA